MGCGGSKLDPTASASAEDTVREKIGPLLRRRLEEFKKRSHASVLKGSQTLSKKELLRHGSDDEETENDVSGGRERSAKVVPAPLEEDKKEVIFEEKPKKRDEEKEKESEELLREENVIGAVTIETREDEENEEDEEGRLSSVDERMICPGSPSFRVYCVDASDDDKDNEGKDEETKKKLQMEDAMDKNNSNERSTTKMENKKGKKGMRFGRVLPKRASGKYMFNVKACYTPGCMGHHHTRLVQEKSVA